LAYLLEWTDVNHGINNWSFVVYDVVADSTVMYANYSDEELQIDSINDLFLKYHAADTVKKMIAVWGICQQKNFVVDQFPIRKCSKSFNVKCSIVKDSVFNTSYQVYKIKDVKIYIENKKGKTNLLWHPGLAGLIYTDVSVLGYIKSPYNDCYVALIGVTEADGEYAYSRVQAIFTVKLDFDFK